MVIGKPNSSQLSVNERLARAREQDLRRCRNLQAKLIRSHPESNTSFQTSYSATAKCHPPNLFASASSSSRAGLMFLSSIEQASKEREQRMRQRQLNRQVAGPIPPESWRDDFDRLSIREGVASHLDRQQLHGLVISSAGRTASQASPGRGDSLNQYLKVEQRRKRTHHSKVCAGLRYIYDAGEIERGQRARLSLRDMALCVVADAINRPCPPVAAQGGKGKARVEEADMDKEQIKQILEYLPKHMQHRLMTLCGRLAATQWPLTNSTAQALIDLNKVQRNNSDQDHASPADDFDEDWETSLDSNPYPYTTAYSNNNNNYGGDGNTTLDLSFSTFSPRTLTGLLSTPRFSSVCLRMLSLAGFNNHHHHESSAFPQTSTTSTALDSTTMHSIFTQLPNLETLCLASTNLSPRVTNAVVNSAETCIAAAAAAVSVNQQRSAVFLRKLCRSLIKLKTLDLSFCSWVSPDAILAVSWGNKDGRKVVAWPRLENLLVVGCEMLMDPRDERVDDDDDDDDNEGEVFEGKKAGNYIAVWHSRHSSNRHGVSINRRVIGDEGGVGTRGRVYDAHEGIMYRNDDPFDLFTTTATNNFTPAVAINTTAATTSSASRAATFGDYVHNIIQPAIISHIITIPTTSDVRQGPSSNSSRKNVNKRYNVEIKNKGKGKEKEEGESVLIEYVQCPRSKNGKVEIWQWQRVRILEAVRGRASPPYSSFTATAAISEGPRQSKWINVWF